MTHSNEISIGLISELEVGAVKIVHHSTSSLIEIIVKGGLHTLFFDYTEFSNLAEAIEKIKNQ